jgi:VanZ family protein
MAIIFYFSSQPGLTVVKGSVEADAITRKFGHMFEFGFLAFLFYRILAQRFSVSLLRSLFFGSALSLMYAASDEFHQTFTPLREGTVRDWTYDASGVVVFLLVFYLIKKRLKK